MPPQRIENETREEMLRRIDNEIRRERRLERWFLRALMTWFLIVVAWHVWPYVSVPKNWPIMFTCLRAVMQIAGCVAALLGFLVTLAWIGSGGQLFKDDLYE